MGARLLDIFPNISFEDDDPLLAEPMSESTELFAQAIEDALREDSLHLLNRRLVAENAQLDADISSLTSDNEVLRAEAVQLRAYALQDVFDVRGDDVVVRRGLPAKRPRVDAPEPVASPSGVALLKEKQDALVRVKREHEDTQDRVLCTICMDAERRALFLPCNHFVACAGCGAAVDKCPFCNASIEGRIIVANAS